MNSVFIGSSAQAQKLSDIEQQLNTVNSTVSTLSGTVDTLNQDVTTLESSAAVGVFKKSVASEAAFYVDGLQLKNKSDLSVSVGDSLYSYPADELVSLPAMNLGTDYAVYATANGLIASSNFTVPDGYNASNSRRIGGFHHQNGVINPYSIYDLKYRPNVRDPRGMVRSPMGIWADIYLLNTVPDLLGTSAYNTTIADGSSPPKVPSVWGGNGTEQYNDFTQYTASRVLAAYGKRLPTSQEFEQLAYGATTGYNVASDPINTKFDASAKSMIGCEQIIGHMYQWGFERSLTDNNSWSVTTVNTNGEGNVYVPSTGLRAVVLGGYWSSAGMMGGARSSRWVKSVWTSENDCSARGVCDHFESF